MRRFGYEIYVWPGTGYFPVTLKTSLSPLSAQSISEVSDQKGIDMVEIVKAFGWPHFTFLFALIVLVVFKSQLAELITRITSIDKSGIKTTPAPEAQREKKKDEVVQELLFAIGDSIVLREIEGRIKADLDERGLESEGDSPKILIKHLAGAKLLLEFEQIQNLIFGSQIFLLKKLNEVVGQGRSREEVEAHFARVKELFEELKGWSFDQYMYFLIKRLLVTVDMNTYHITNLGVEYLTWMARTGQGEGKPL